jgi:Fe2+ transport system protein FeoA
MILKNQNAGQIFLIKDIPEKFECQNCKVCMRIRLMEMGLMPGSLIELTKHQAGLWIVNILSDTGQVESTIALREEEAERIILEDNECSIGFEPYY